MIIRKFGGIAIGSISRMQSVAKIVVRGVPQILVISAMSGTTNLLGVITKLLENGKTSLAQEQANRLEEKYLKIANDMLSTANHRAIGKKIVKDQFNIIKEIIDKEFTIDEDFEIMARGEILSSALLHTYLSERNFNIVYLPALDFMQIDENGKPNQEYINEKLNGLLDKHRHNKIFITQGYICRNHLGKIVNLGSGGSDYSAALIGVATDAEEIEIWTDMDGIHNNDPACVSDTNSIKQLSFDEAAELAYFGEKQLHPGSIYPVQKSNIPVCIKNMLEPSAKGTSISSEVNQEIIKAVAARDGIIAIKIKTPNMLMEYGYLQKVFEIFARYKTPVDMITTSEVAISVTIDDDTHLNEIKNELKELGKIKIDRNQTLICIVGNLVANNKGIAEKIFTAISNVPVRMISYGGSNFNLSLLVNTIDKGKALKALHKHLC